MRKIMEKWIEEAKKKPKRIVYPESTEERTLKAIETITREGIACPVLIGDEKEIIGRIKELGLAIDRNTVEIIGAEDSKKLDSYSQEFYRLRKHKGITLEKARKKMKEPVHFGVMMVQTGDADGLISGAVHPTSHTLLPAFEIIGTKKKFHKVSGVFFMMFKNKLMLFADAAVEPDPDAKDLANIAIDTAMTAKRFGLEPEVAMLSFSTKGSAKHPMVKKVKEATEIAQYHAPDLLIDGELQLDAAVDPKVCRIKCPDCKLHGGANVLIFPELNAANIGYKLATFFGKAQAVGPVLQGLKKPVNDLSRGCSVREIVDITAITVIEAQKKDYGNAHEQAD
ncbi:MAG: phosphate acetyltransferase [Candidatus Woesearchaeota archaeon]